MKREKDFCTFSYLAEFRRFRFCINMPPNTPTRTTIATQTARYCPIDALETAGIGTDVGFAVGAGVTTGVKIGCGVAVGFGLGVAVV